MGEFEAQQDRKRLADRIGRKRCGGQGYRKHGEWIERVLGGGGRGRGEQRKIEKSSCGFGETKAMVPRK